MDRHYCVPVVVKSEIPRVIRKCMDDTRGSGARKLNKRMKEQYSGISERKIQNTLDRSTRYQLNKARFGNKPIPKPIKARQVQDRHQIDLLNMGKWKITQGRSIYRYIVTVVDVFSRYIWLRPLKSKHRVEIANHLDTIYSEHGPPKILQHDRGTEFQGAVRRLMESMQVRIIQSSPYHPQNQGKVERTQSSKEKDLI